MNHAAAVEAFLTDVVNLNATRLAQLETRVSSIVSALCADAVIGPMYLDHIPQGSWPQKTIIRPVGEFDEFDADFLLKLAQNSFWNLEPRRYLRELRAGFKRNSTYAGMVQKKNRCCRIDYANDCHVDVVPYLVLPDGRQVIINYAENKFEDTNPDGFTAWMKEKDELAERNLRKALRLLKYIRDYKNTFDCPSVILTTLLGGAVQAFDADKRYADVATAFVNLLADLDVWLVQHPRMPYLEDPSCPGTSFNHRWTEEKYQTFKTCISRYAAWAKVALVEADDDRAVAAWQQLFGTSFKKPPVAAVVSAVVKAAMPLLPLKRAPREQFIEEQGLAFTGGYTARIDGRIAPMHGFRDGDIRTFGALPKHRTLRFRVTTDAPPPYRVLWKVRNRGDEAERLDGLRGELVPDDGTQRRTESTLYSGRHFVEAYVVKGNSVVATDHFEVRIA